MVNAITPSEAQNYTEIGPVDCFDEAYLEESCRNQLRNKAADQGADLIVVEARDNDGKNIHIYARAYKSKTKAM